MIFSNQELHTALSYLAAYYNKILKVDLKKDRFEPIKIANDEWNNNITNMSFVEWMKNFEESDISSAFHIEIVLPMLYKGVPGSYSYYKKIDGEWHEMVLEYLPTDRYEGFIFVLDNDYFNIEEIKACTKD